MILFKLAWKSLKNRLTSSVLTITSIALSVALLFAVERTQRAAEEGFTQSVSQVDLLVGAKTGPLNLILYTVFNMGSANNNISWESYQDIKSKPQVDWTIPYSLGDGHKGFRVVATDENFYQHYRFRGDQSVEFKTGQPALDVWDVVIGSDVEKKLKYKLGDSVVIAHGVTKGEALQFHDDKPFRVVGILKPTGTALDQSIYISLYGMEAIHMDWKDGAAPQPGQSVSAASIKKENIKIGPITAFFLRTKSRIETLRLQREINTYVDEPLLAIIPGATLSELWRGLSQIDVILKIISVMVLAVGLASMVSSLLASLNERRREMSILRSLGATTGQITLLLVFESTFLTLIGVLFGALLNIIAVWSIASWLQSEFGFYITGAVFTMTDIIYGVIIVVAGVFVGLLPALQARQRALKDGLTIKV